MSTKILFKQKIEADVTRAQTELARFRNSGMAFTAKARDVHDRHVAELERKLDATKVKLRELDDAEEHVWESLKDGAESTWGSLQSALHEAVVNFDTELNGSAKGGLPKP